MSDYFPQDMLANIFLRLSVKSLGICACVCKAWKSLITDDGFIHDHFVRTIQANNGIGSLRLWIDRPNIRSPIGHDLEFYTVDLDNEKFDCRCTFKCPFIARKCSQVVGSCNGVVCLVDYMNTYGDAFIIWNPFIGKYVKLPKPQVRYYPRGGFETCVGFGFDSRNKDFKVVRLVAPYRDPHPPQVEICSLATESWKTITDTPASFRDYSDLDGKIQPHIFINGIIHWVVSRKHNLILTFNVVEERFGELMLPLPLKESVERVSILEGGEKLTVVRRYESQVGEEYFSIWVMEEYGVVESWKEVFNSELLFYAGKARAVALRNSGKLVLEVMRARRGFIVSLDLRSNIERNLGVKGDSWHSFVGYYVGSLFLLNKQNLTRKRKRKSEQENIFFPS